MEEIRFLRKSSICKSCNKILEFKINKKQLSDLKNKQLFNFVIMHAEDHTLVVAIDARGEIRRTRIAKLNLSDSLRIKDKTSVKLIKVIEKSENLCDAFQNWLEKEK